MTNIAEVRVPCNAAEMKGGIAGLGRFFLASLNQLDLWYERSQQRRHLTLLDDRLLDDIGIDRTAAMQEASKPFWLG